MRRTVRYYRTKYERGVDRYYELREKHVLAGDHARYRRLARHPLRLYLAFTKYVEYVEGEFRLK